MPYSSAINSATLTGRLTRDPALRTVSTAAGASTSVLTLGLAVRRIPRQDREEEPSAAFFDVTVWGGLAERCAAHLSKGRLVSVLARLEPTQWEATDGSPRRGIDVVACDVQYLDHPRRDGEATPADASPPALPAAA
jgi:single-strand DNA-binding protein